MEKGRVRVLPKFLFLFSLSILFSDKIEKGRVLRCEWISEELVRCDFLSADAL